MRTFLLLLLMSFFTSAVTAQATRFQTYTAVMKITAVKNGQQYEWENKNISVVLDYKNGDFTCRLMNTDFYDPANPQNFVSDSIQDRLEFTLTGIFPVREIINQKTINQNYKVELQLVNQELRLNYTILFNMTIMRPNPSGDGNYRVFQMEGTIYNDEAGLPAFRSFDNEVTVRLAFNGYAVTQ